MEKVRGIYDHGKQFEMFNALVGDGRGMMYGVLYFFGVASGLRIGDILSVTAGQIGEDMLILEQKTQKIKRIRLDKQVLELISEYAKLKSLKPHERLFPVTRQTVLAHFKHAADAVGLENIGTHSMRYSYG
jgi:integrase